MPYCTMRYVSTIARAGDTFLFASARDGQWARRIQSQRHRQCAHHLPVRASQGHDLRVVCRCQGRGLHSRPAWRTCSALAARPAAPSGRRSIRRSSSTTRTPRSTRWSIPMGPCNSPPRLMMRRSPHRKGRSAMSAACCRCIPYGNRVPSTEATDFVVGTGRALNFTKTIAYNVFDGFNHSYSGSSYAFMVNGSGHVFKNMRYQGVPMTWNGSGHKGENLFTLTHVHQRDSVAAAGRRTTRAPAPQARSRAGTIRSATLRFATTGTPRSRPRAPVVS